MPTFFLESDRKKLLQIALIIAAVGAWLFFGPYGILKYYKVTRELREVLLQNDRLHSANAELQQEIDKLKKDPAHVEEIARRQFGLIKKNEVIYEFPEKKKKHD